MGDIKNKLEASQGLLIEYSKTTTVDLFFYQGLGETSLTRSGQVKTSPQSEESAKVEGKIKSI